MNIYSFVHTIQYHSRISSLLTFLVALSEAVAIFGVFVPGTAIIIIVGALISTYVLPLWSTTLCALTGAFCGDYISYWMGKSLDQRLQKMWPFANYPHWLINAERFFNHHGGKSIIIGRLFGPMRGITPLVAGIFRIRQLPFITMTLLAIVLWGICYLLPGILFGSLILEQPNHFFIKLIAIVIVALIAIWLTSKKICQSIKKQLK